jgi:hypothetical protein
MKWFSKMKISDRFSAESDRLEIDADEGSSSMFRILGPLAQKSETAAVTAAIPAPSVFSFAPQTVRSDSAPAAQNQAVLKLKLMFDDTAYFNETESLNFR